MAEHTILARSPTGEREESEKKNVVINKKRVLSIFTGLWDDQLTHRIMWKSIRDYQLPYNGHFDDTADGSNVGRKRDRKVKNSSTWSIAQIFSSGLMSNLTPPSRPWFRLIFSDPELSGDIRLAKILEERQEIINAVLLKSNFYNAMHMVYSELPFGQCPCGVFSDAENGIRFVPYTIGTYALDMGVDGQVNTFAKKSKMTAFKIEEQFGEENLPNNVRQALEKDSGGKQEFVVNWIVIPNKQAVKGSVKNTELPYISLYWVDGNKDEGFLYQGGFHEFPIPTARYLVNPDDVYGRGPGWFSDGDAKQLHIFEDDLMRASNMKITPPVVIQSDSMTNIPISLIPGGLTQVNNPNSVVKPLFEVNMDTQHQLMIIERVKEQIKKNYSADLFMQMGELEKKERMTTTEVLARSQERLQQLGPVTERMQFEFLNPNLNRVYNILDRAGVFPPLPTDISEMLENKEIKIDYISPLAQAQKMAGVANIEQNMSFGASIASITQDLTVFDNYDIDDIIRQYAMMVGPPAKNMREASAVEEMRQARQQAQQQDKQQQQFIDQAPAVAQMAQAAAVVQDQAQSENVALSNLMGV